MQQRQICPNHGYPILKKSQTKSCCKILTVSVNSESMSNNYLVIITPKSIYVLFQVMHEVYTEKIMTGTVFGYLILIQPHSQGLSSLFLDQGRQRRETLRSRLIKIDKFRYINIQPQTIDLRTRLWEINPTNSVFIPQSLVLRSIV